MASHFNDSGLTYDPTYFDQVCSMAAHSIFLYFTPVVIVLGSIGNLLSIYVFYHSGLRAQSTSQYLSALAISDTVFLLQLLEPWLSAMNVSSFFYARGFCQVFVYLSYVSCCLSAWLVAAFTIERFVAVIYPLRRNQWCTVSRARCVILCLTVAAAVINLPVLRFTVPLIDDCNLDMKYLKYAESFNYLDTIVAFTIPLGLIVILNMWIIYGIYHPERNRHQLMKTENRTLNEEARETRPIGFSHSQQRVTRMLLTVSFVFVFLNLPAYLLRIFAYAYELGTKDITGRWSMFQQLAVMFFHMNFGINFMLYCLTGQNFRRAVANCLSCLWTRARRSFSMRRPTANRRQTAGAGSASSLSAGSYYSHYTEATNIPSASVSSPRSRRRKPKRFIKRWKFDNSRRRRQPAISVTSSSARQDIEMRNLHRAECRQAHVHRNQYVATTTF